MKTIRKLHVRSGQELSVAVQDQVMAGSGWNGACHCSAVGHSHEETRYETYTYTDFVEYAVGQGLYWGGICMMLSGGGAAAGFGMSCSGVAVMHQSTKTATIWYHREMRLEQLDPRTHKQVKTWTTPG